MYPCVYYLQLRKLEQIVSVKMKNVVKASKKGLREKIVDN